MEEQIIKLVAEVLEVDETSLSLETHQEALEEWDSLAHIRIISEVEEQLGVSIAINEVIEIHTIGDLIKAIKKA